jgi:hypothetical protein
MKLGLLSTNLFVFGNKTLATTSIDTQSDNVGQCPYSTVEIRNELAFIVLVRSGAIGP